MSRRKFSLSHNRDLSGGGWSRRVNHISKTHCPTSVSPEGPPQVYESGPKKGEVVTLPAEALGRVTYLLGVSIGNYTNEAIASFMKRFARWLNSPANKKVSGKIEAELLKRERKAKVERLRREPGLNKEMLEAIAAAIVQYWIRESANLIRSGKEPAWILSMFDGSEDIRNRRGGSIVGSLELREKAKYLSEIDKENIKNLAIQIASETISNSKKNDEAYELVSIFHPVFRRRRNR